MAAKKTTKKTTKKAAKKTTKRTTKPAAKKGKKVVAKKTTTKKTTKKGKKPGKRPFNMSDLIRQTAEGEVTEKAMKTKIKAYYTKEGHKADWIEKRMKKLIRRLNGLR